MLHGDQLMRNKRQIIEEPNALGIGLTEGRSEKEV